MDSLKMFYIYFFYFFFGDCFRNSSKVSFGNSSYDFSKSYFRNSCKNLFENYFKDTFRNSFIILSEVATRIPLNIYPMNSGRQWFFRELHQVFFFQEFRQEFPHKLLQKFRFYTLLGGFHRELRKGLFSGIPPRISVVFIFLQHFTSECIHVTLCTNPSKVF